MPEPLAAPEPKRKRKARKLPVFLSDAESAELLKAAASPRDALLIGLGLYQGLRVSEIVGLKVERVNLPDSSLLVYQGKGGKDRVLPLHPTIFAALRTWIGERREGWLFPSPLNAERHLTARTVQLIAKKTAKAANIHRPNASISPHKWRHSFATACLRKGANLRQVQQLLGHSSVAITEIYTHVTADELREAIAKR